MEYILEAKDICKSIENSEERINILKNVNLYIKENEYVAIMGPSGS